MDTQSINIIIAINMYSLHIQSFNHQSQPLFFNVNITSHYTLHISAHMQAIIRCCKHKIIRDGIVTLWIH
jgi:hypothetical protein